MATSSGRAPKDILCRYFANNACNKGENCPFSHDRNSKPDTVCRYYLSGFCAYGDRCRFDHKRRSPRGPEEVTSASSVDGKVQSPSSRLEAKPRGTTSSPGRSSVSSECSNASEPFKFSTEAAVFVPSWIQLQQSDEKSYADITGASSVRPLCPYHVNGLCPKNNDCSFAHGLVCDLCNLACLHPDSEELRVQHRRECTAVHEAAMEKAFAEARSVDKVCGICMENIRQRKVRFGILQGCKHCFCLSCIRKWRSNQNEIFEKETLRSCPECRTHSDFVVPAEYWVEDPEDKRKLFAEFRENTKKKQCKYIRGGDISECPFGNKCFYKHELPDGTIAEGESPRLMRRRNQHSFSYILDELLSDSDSDGEHIDVRATIEFLERLDIDENDFNATEWIYSMGNV